MKLFICPLPPPFHGQANVSQDTVALFRKKIVIDTNKVNESLSKKILFYFTYLLKFCYYITKFDIKTIYFTPSRSRFGSLRDLPVLLVGYLSRKKIIAHIHGGDFDSFIEGLNIVFRKLLIRLYAECTYLVFPMKQIAEDTETTLQLRNTITISNYLKNPTIYEADFDSSTCIQLLFMSNILRTKGINEFLQTIKKLAYYNIGYDARVAGSFMKGSEAEQKAVLESAESGLITYLGFIQNGKKKKVLSECDFFILPSYSEAFPLVILEAMISGCIIITSNKKYHKYLIDESFGRTFDFNTDIHLIINFIRNIKDNPPKMKEMKRAARQKAKNYTFEKYRKAIIGLLDES